MTGEKDLQKEYQTTKEMMEQLFIAEMPKRKTREDGDTVWTGEYED